MNISITEIPQSNVVWLLWIWLGAVGAAASTSTPPGNSIPKLEGLGIRCTVDAKEMMFAEHVRAATTPESGVLLVGYRGTAVLMIQVPRSSPGVYRLKDSPTTHFYFSRSLYSSDSRDHFRANTGTPQSQLEVNVWGLDERTKIISGAFSAVALSGPESLVRITNGVFALKLEAARVPAVRTNQPSPQVGEGRETPGAAGPPKDQR